MSMEVGFLLEPGDDASPMAEALSAHPAIHVARNAHVLTGLAHLGYYDKVRKASYDHILAAEAQRLFVERLPRKEADYVAACRAYAETLYARSLDAEGKALLLDSTPVYLRFAAFLRRVFPEAPRVVVTCHPLLVLARHGALARRMIEDVAALLRCRETPVLRVRIEDFAAEPSAQVDAVCAHLGVPFDAALCEAAQAVAARIVPVERALSSLGLAEAQRFIRSLAREDLAAYGYSIEDVWMPLDTPGHVVRRVAPAWRSGMRARVTHAARGLAQRPGLLNRLLRRLRLVCDVLLRPPHAQ